MTIEVPVNSSSTDAQTAGGGSWSEVGKKSKIGILRIRIPDTDREQTVSAWDGEWTYAELENVSSRLAKYIQTLDLKQGQAMLLISYEKLMKTKRMD